MSWITLIWSMVASACLTLAAVHLLVWRQQRGSPHHGLFALSAVGTAAHAANELWLLRSETGEELGQAIRWGHLPFWVVMLSLVGFVRLYMRAGRRGWPGPSAACARLPPSRSGAGAIGDRWWCWAQASPSSSERAASSLCWSSGELSRSP